MSHRVNQIMVENRRNSFFSITMFTIYAMLILKYRDDIQKTSHIHYEPIICLLVSTGLYGIEFLLQSYAGTKFNLDYGIKSCKFVWFYIVSSCVFNFWGVHYVFGSKFASIKVNATDMQIKIYSMTMMIMIFRFIGAIIIMIFLFLTLMHYIFKYKLEKNESNKKDQKICLENLFVCLMPGMTPKHVLRGYSNSQDGLDSTCAICLGNFSETPRKLIVQLECGQTHKFHFECFKDWITKQQNCPLCRTKFYF